MGASWYTINPEKKETHYTQVSLQNHAKYQNLENQSTLYNNKRPNFGNLKYPCIPYTLLTVQGKKTRYQNCLFLDMP